MKLIIEGLSKSYGDLKAVDNVCITLEKGLYGLLGENGAGKSTLIKLIVGLEKADTGKVIYKRNDKEFNLLDSIGYLPQTPAYYPNFTADEFIRYICGLKMDNLSRSNILKETEKVLHYVNLIEYRNKKIKEFSGGMKQRLAIAVSLINDPDILILDEPTVGLDLIERINLRNLLVKLSAYKIIILATHIVSDIEFIAKEIIMMQKGKITNRGSISEFLSKMENKAWYLKVDKEMINQITEDFIVSNLYQDNEEYILKILSDEKPCHNAYIAKPSLEDYCIYFYGVSHDIRNKKAIF